MSQESIGIGRRSLEALLIRFPFISRLAIRLMIALPASRLRRRIWLASYRWTFSSFDRLPFELWRSYVHPDVVVDFSHSPRWGLDVGEQASGWDALEEMYRRLREPWEKTVVRVDGIADSGRDRLAAALTMSATGHGSGLEVVDSVGYVLSYRSGYLVRLELYDDPEHALEAAGLSE